MSALRSEDEKASRRKAVRPPLVRTLYPSARLARKREEVEEVEEVEKDMEVLEKEQRMSAAFIESGCWGSAETPGSEHLWRAQRSTFTIALIRKPCGWDVLADDRWLPRLHRRG